MDLAALPLNTPARIAQIDREALGETAARRLRALGFDVGVGVESLHQGGMIAKDPIAVRVGRMTVALRKSQALAIQVEML